MGSKREPSPLPGWNISMWLADAPDDEADAFFDALAEWAHDYEANRAWDVHISAEVSPGQSPVDETQVVLSTPSSNVQADKVFLVLFSVTALVFLSLAICSAWVHDIAGIVACLVSCGFNSVLVVDYIKDLSRQEAPAAEPVVLSTASAEVTL